MVYRIYVEKKAGLAAEADGLRSKINNLLGIKGLTGLRLLNRYDAEGLDKDLFDYCTNTVFSEPQLDDLLTELPTDGAVTFAVEFLPGQFDQRAASAAECIQIISKQDRPLVRSAKVYVLYGELTDADVNEIKKFLINPVESREATLDTFETLDVQYEIPTEVATMDGFIKLDEAGLEAFVKDMGLAMDLDDIKVCQAYFLSEDRDPTITEIKMIDTYWSDHCRHTTFLTTIDKVTFEDELLQNAYNEYIATRDAIGRTKPINLMDIGTIAAKFLKKEGKLDGLDESEEINACTVKIDVDVEGETQKWLLLFKNENHQEILRQCGFSDSKYFYRYFMEEFKTTPAGWKELQNLSMNRKVEVLDELFTTAAKMINTTFLFLKSDKLTKFPSLSCNLNSGAFIPTSNIESSFTYFILHIIPCVINLFI